jgi:hypothetical protein
LSEKACCDLNLPRATEKFGAVVRENQTKFLDAAVDVGGYEEAFDFGGSGARGYLLRDPPGLPENVRLDASSKNVFL